MKKNCSPSQTAKATVAAAAARPTAGQRLARAAARPTITIGATTNSLANTPSIAAPAASAARSCSSHRVTSGPRKNISGSLVNGSYNVYIDPNPNAEIAPASSDWRGVNPNTTHKT